MGENTKIEWADYTFNPWWGCEKIAPECAHCYAETWAKRTGHEVWGGDGSPRRFFAHKHWDEPLHWDIKAEREGTRPRVFCASMADVFEDRRDLDEQRDRLWRVIAMTPHLIWMLLTKRPKNWNRMVPREWLTNPPSNVWAMTTGGCQETVDRNVPDLLKINAVVRGVSCEPMLGPVDFVKAGLRPEWKPAIGDPPLRPLGMNIDWIIVGGESGAAARPMHSDWVRDVRDQCVETGVAFFFKQWGEYLPREIMESAELGDADKGRFSCHVFEDQSHTYRVGKARAGRMLDGRTWDEVPREQERKGVMEC